MGDLLRGNGRRLLTLALVVAQVLLVAGTATARDPQGRSPMMTRRSFTVAATGDLLIHTPVWQTAATSTGYDFGPQLAAAAPTIAGADLGICHLEVPLDPDGPYSSYPRFNAPAELATAIAATGWDTCSTASNHSADQGVEGLHTTLAALESAGVDHRGMHRSAEEHAALRTYRVNGVTIGHISATYGLNGLPQPGGHPWSVNLIDEAWILERTRALRAAGAEVVLVSLHWGNEYQHAPSSFQRQVAATLMTGGEVDAILGHHAHVVQPVERIAGNPVVYGMGNFLSGQRPTERRDGVVVLLDFAETGDGWRITVTAQPTWVDDAYHVRLAHPDDPGALGASARRTLGYLGVPLAEG